MNKIYEKNIRYLKNLSLDLYNEVEKTQIKTVHINRSKNGALNLKKDVASGRINVHSSYNPQRAAKHICDKMMLSDNKNVIVFGIGMAYELKEMIKKDKLRKFIFIEPDMEIFKCMLQYTDITSFFNSNNNIRFIMYDNSNDISGNLLNLIKEDIDLSTEFFILPFYKIVYKELIEQSIKEFKKRLDNFKVNMATHLYFHEQWFLNYGKGLKYLKESCPIEELKGAFKGIPAIIAAAGPSIKYNLESLKKIAGKVVLASAGTGINILENNKIKANIIALIDGAPDESLLVRNLVINKETSIFYGSMVYDEVLDYCSKYRFLLNVDVMDNYIRKNFGLENKFSFSAPSVANIIAGYLGYLGCNPIILLGQDLCYSSGLNYAEGSIFTKKIDEKELKKYEIMKNVRGDDVYTTKSFLSMRNAMEFIINKMFPNTIFYNGTRDGLPIKGAKNIEFDSYVEYYINYNTNNNIDNVLLDTYNKYLHKISNYDILVDNFIGNIKKENQDMIKFCKHIINCVDNDLELNEKDKLEFIKNTEIRIEQNQFYKYIIKPLIKNVLYIYSSKGKLDYCKQIYSYMLNLCNIFELSFDDEFRPIYSH